MKRGKLGLPKFGEIQMIEEPLETFECPCHSDWPKTKSRYNVDIVDRIKDVMGEEFTVIDENTEVIYKFQFGYETLEIHTLGGGSLHYTGSYHPNNGICVSSGGLGKPGVCEYCGSTLF